MSYILDALRKADAERARGALPDLHTQPVLHPSSTRAPRLPWLLGGAAALAVAVLVAVLTGALLTRREAAQPVAVVNTTGPATVAASTPASASVVALLPTPPVLAAILAAPVAAVRIAAPVSTQPSAQPPTPALPPAPPPAAPAEIRVYAMSELPESIRRELPVLSAGGAMHSDNPAHRMLILNGQVFHERDVIAPDLTLVQVQLKSALLEFRGYRYRITY